MGLAPSGHNVGPPLFKGVFKKLIRVFEVASWYGWYVNDQSSVDFFCFSSGARLARRVSFMRACV
jgi:hypothetical protein